jgi:hypothetical protein
MTKRLLTLAALALAVPALVALACYLLTKPLDVRAALPLRAIFTMDEYYWDAGMLPDFVHCVRVMVSEAEFRRFVTKMGLVPYHGRGKFPECEYGASWWDASAEASRSFAAPRNGSAGGTEMIAKFENGKLYYYAEH